MGHDLADFGGMFISVTSIHAVSNEVEFGQETGVVHIDYGHGNRMAFEGTAETVMQIIDGYYSNN